MPGLRTIRYLLRQIFVSNVFHIFIFLLIKYLSRVYHGYTPYVSSFYILFNQVRFYFTHPPVTRSSCAQPPAGCGPRMYTVHGCDLTGMPWHPTDVAAYLVALFPPPSLQEYKWGQFFGPILMASSKIFKKTFQKIPVFQFGHILLRFFLPYPKYEIFKTFK